jgi:hypothetical protein
MLMSATGLEVFDTTVQKTNVWLKDLMEVMGEIGARLIRPCAPVDGCGIRMSGAPRHFANPSARRLRFR